MPMQFIVNQMTGNAPVTYFPPSEIKRQERKPHPKWKRISDSELKNALHMHKQGMSWDAIGRELGRTGHGIFGALKRRGML